MGPIERVARRSQFALFAFTVLLAVTGFGLLGAVVSGLLGFWVAAAAAMMSAVFGAAGAALVVRMCRRRPLPEA